MAKKKAAKKKATAAKKVTRKKSAKTPPKKKTAKKKLAKKSAVKKQVKKKSAVKKKTTKKAVKKPTKKATFKKKANKKAAARPKTGIKRKSAKAISGFQRFELVDGKSSKFWEIKQHGSQYTVRFGRIGTEGQARTKDMGSSEKAAAEVEKLIRAKVNKGYVKISGDMSVALTGRKSSAAKPSKKSTTRDGVRNDVSFKSNMAKKAAANEILTNEVARQFIADGYSIDIGKFTAIEDDAVKTLSHSELPLNLEGLKYLSNVAAKNLARNKQILDLSGLESISDATIVYLSKQKRISLMLNGLTSLSKAAAISLAKGKYDLQLYGLKSISDNAATNLAKHEGYLAVDLTSLPKSAAAILRKHPSLAGEDL